MSDTDTVRAIIQDLPQYISATATGDGRSLDYSLPYSPLVSGSLKVYLNGSLQNSGYTEDDNLGVVSFNNPPAPSVLIDMTAQTVLLTDTQISSFLALYPDSEEGDAIWLTAADCLDIIASSQALIQKKIKLSDMDIDGPALAKSLRDHADKLRDNVREGNESSFEIIEQINDIPGYREKILKDFLRDS